MGNKRIRSPHIYTPVWMPATTYPNGYKSNSGYTCGCPACSGMTKLTITYLREATPEELRHVARSHPGNIKSKR